MLTGRDELVAAQIQQERLRQAELERLYRQLPGSHTGLRLDVAALLSRLRASVREPAPAAKGPTIRQKVRG